MLGWEFPPFISGGLGTACYGLTKALDRLGIDITFVLPQALATEKIGHMRTLSAQGGLWAEKIAGLKHTSFLTIGSALRPYIDAILYEQQLAHQRHRRTKVSCVGGSGCPEKLENYGSDIYQEVQRYASKVFEIAKIETFDIIHAHDWMTFPAGMAAAESSGKPLVVHIHSTEFDRSGEHVNQVIYNIEREGMHTADKVIVVSNYTKNIIISRYDVPPAKVEVVYNGVEDDVSNGFTAQKPPQKGDRIVLFLGRITMQKGPEYFLAAAKRVLEKTDNVKFVVAGRGDMMYRIVEMAAAMGIGHKVLFTGFLRGSDVDRIYGMADLYVMSSVSEPFGIAPLEALSRNVPVLISKQSGIAEVLTHALKVDFWDINQMANKIAAVLKYAPLRTMLQENGRGEVHRFRWEDSASRVSQIYHRTLARSA